MAEVARRWTPYQYAYNNPIRFIDPDGMFASPYYDENGKHLGNDEFGFNGQIYITTQEAFKKYSTDGVADSKSIQESSETTEMQDVYLSNSAEAKIYTDVLSKLDGVDAVNLLLNGSVSIYQSTFSDGIRGYNNPEKTGRFKTKNFDQNQIRVTARAGSNRELYTVEAIQNYLGVHELLGHGVNNYSGGEEPGGTHYKAYLDQFNHKTFTSLNKEQNNEVIKRAVEFMYSENRSAYNVMGQNNSLLYQKYWQIFK